MASSEKKERELNLLTQIEFHNNFTFILRENYLLMANKGLMIFF